VYEPPCVHEAVKVGGAGGQGLTLVPFHYKLDQSTTCLCDLREPVCPYILTASSCVAWPLVPFKLDQSTCMCAHSHSEPLYPCTFAASPYPACPLGPSLFAHSLPVHTRRIILPSLAFPHCMLIVYRYTLATDILLPGLATRSPTTVCA